MSAGVEECGAIGHDLGDGNRRDPNVKATTQELYDGLVARRSERLAERAQFDVGAVSGLVPAASSRPASTTRPSWVCRPSNGAAAPAYGCSYEKLIRRAAGMGEASRAPDPDRYEHGHAFCDVSGGRLRARRPVRRPGRRPGRARRDSWSNRTSLLGGDLLNQGNGRRELRRARRDLIAAL